MRKLLPIILIISGVGVGAGAGFALRPAEDARKADTAASLDPGQDDPKEKPDNSTAKKPNEVARDEEPAFVKLTNQFIVPVVTDVEVTALVVLSLTLETDAANTDTLYALEPKIRDASLRVLFNHAYAGGFDGQFTTPDKMDALRKSLTKAANNISGGVVRDVLITDIIRQDN